MSVKLTTLSHVLNYIVNNLRRQPLEKSITRDLSCQDHLMAVEQFTLCIFPQLTVEFYYCFTVVERQKGLSLSED